MCNFCCTFARKLETPFIFHKMSKVLLISTGGTITMVRDKRSNALVPADMETFKAYLPELFETSIDVDIQAFTPLIDSSDIGPISWNRMAQMVAAHYDEYDGFVILHGTDTMAFTASALSFMLENLGKPVIFTGSQLPIGQLRTDGKENLLTSIEIAAAKTADGQPMVPEVCIFFENKLLRGNRTTKINAEGFNAFRSYNLPALAKAGIHIKYDTHLIRRPDPTRPFCPHYLMDSNILILTLFPGMRREIIDGILQQQGIKAVILQTFGSGNAPQKPWLFDRLRELDRKGVILVNVTQCSTGTVEMGRYETGLQLLQAGAINGYDSTMESVVTKLMFLLGHGYSKERIIELMNTDIAGEITLTE